MEPFGAFFGTKCTPYLEARQKARSGVKGLTELILLFKLSYLSSNFALTLGYLDPALNNPAHICLCSCVMQR